MHVEVEVGNEVITCELRGHGTCKRCGAGITWGVTEEEKFLPLDVQDSGQDAVLHFRTCTARHHAESRGPSRAHADLEAVKRQARSEGFENGYTKGRTEGLTVGIREGYALAKKEAVEAAWPQDIVRVALRLLHPDRFHGTSEERAANDVTRWLLSKRSS